MKVKLNELKKLMLRNGACRKGVYYHTRGLPETLDVEHEWKRISDYSRQDAYTLILGKKHTPSIRDCWCRDVDCNNPNVPQEILDALAKLPGTEV